MFTACLQGCIDDAYFLGALAALARCRRDLLLDLVISDDLGSRSQPPSATFKFFKYGAWRHVTVDGRLPLVALAGEAEGRAACVMRGGGVQVRARAPH